MHTHPQKQPPVKLPLRLLLIVLFAVQITLVVGVVGCLSFRNGQRAVNNVTHHLRSKITANIEDHLRTFLATPQQINQINANLIHLANDRGVYDQDALERYFWEQIQVFDSVTSIYFGNPMGGIVLAGREGADGSLYVIATDEFRSGPFRKFATDSEGNRQELLTAIPDFDARTRSWYSKAIEEDQPTWSDIYILFTGQDMAIAASRPLYDEQHNLLGVLSSDIFASHLSNFLQNLDIGETGSSFIMERSGLLVASSTDEKPFTNLSEEEPQRRLHANESTIPAIRSAAEFLTGQFGDYHNITGEQQLFEFDMNGQRQFLQVLPVQDEYGIDWLVVVILPESDFMAQINANNLVTMSLMGLALIFAIILGIFTAQWITRPVLHLNDSTKALAKGEWEQPLNGEWISEIDDLAHSFNDMVGQLKQTMESLSSEIAEHTEAEKMLRQSEEKYRSLIENSSDAIYLLYETRFDLINPRFTELLGVTAKEACAPDFDFMSLVASKSRPLINERIAKQSRGEELSPYYEFTAQDKTGNEIEIEASVSYVPYREGTATQGILRNVTERLQAEELLQQSKRRLEEALTELRETQERMMHQERLAAVGQLADGVAHEFNNILAAIILYTQMMLEMDESTPGMHKRLQVIATQADRGANLVQQILDFGRRSMIRRTLLAMDSFLEQVIDLLTRTLPESIRIDLVFEPGEYMMEADSTRVQQAVVNLALNARDFMPNGGGVRVSFFRGGGGSFNCVECGPVVGGEWILVEVRDNGVGIPADVLPHIFEPFFTTRAPLGHGLGLAQVYGIMKQHEGHIAMETEVGKGTAFKLYWPALLVKPPETESTGWLDADQGEGKTILVVEDNAVLRTAMVEGMSLMGFQVLEAADGQEALAVCENHKGEIALVVSDWVMPVMNGLELARQLEKQDAPIKVLFITGHPLDDDTKGTLPENVIGWVLQPLNLKQLAEAISKGVS